MMCELGHVMNCCRDEYGGAHVLKTVVSTAHVQSHTQTTEQFSPLCFGRNVRLRRRRSHFFIEGSAVWRGPAGGPSRSSSYAASVTRLRGGCGCETKLAEWSHGPGMCQAEFISIT
jgi:hypothetical protein